MIDNNQIVAALQTVTNPLNGMDIISSKLVRDLHISDNNVTFTLALPSNTAPELKQQLNFSCIEAVNKTYPKAQVHVHVTLEKPMVQPVNSPLPQVKNIIAVGSGKGGVGKSTVSVNLALGLAALGAKVGLLDADVYGPSIPTMLGLQGQRPKVQDVDGVPKIVPLEKYGIKTISIGFIIDPEQAIVLRGPRLGGIIKQFFNDCLWGDLDYLVIDLPPGTGDVHLSLVQTVPVTGAVMVTTPQEVAVVDAIKAINMFLMPNVNVPILGIVENMSWFTPAELPDNKYFIFGEGGGKRLAQMSNSVLLGQIPIVQSIRESGDAGKPAVVNDEPITQEAFINVAKNVARQVLVRNETLAPTQKVNVAEL